MKNIKANAKVQITIEVPAGGCWTGDCQINQIYKQSKIEVIDYIKKTLMRTDIKLIGEPKIITILTEN